MYGLRVFPGEEGEAELLLGRHSEFYPDSYPCFVCGHNVAHMVEVVPAELFESMTFHDVSPQEALAAMNGLGLPSEHDCSATAVQQLFASQAVKRVVSRPIRNSHRCVVQYIEFENGTRAYFGASTHGATVYRVTPKHSYAKAQDAQAAHHPQLP